jgi:hypothetical protein
MESYIILAAAIPFAFVGIVVFILATVRYSITNTHLIVSVLGFAVRKAPLAMIESVEYVPPGKQWGVLRQSGAVVANMGPDKRPFVFSPGDAESFAESLRAAVEDRTRRDK